MERVIHGDACEVLPTLDVKANLILTSPPYDKLRTYGGHTFDFDRMADACVGTLAEGGVLVWVVADATVDGSETGTSFRHALGFLERGLKLHDTMIYRKLGPPLTFPDRYVPSFEYMFVFSLGRPTTANLLRDKPNITMGQRDVKTRQGRTGDNQAGWSGHYVRHEYGVRQNIWSYLVGKGQGARRIGNEDFREIAKHPATFPILLARDHITTWTNPGDLVLDPMAGSGTTLRAAKDLNRDSIAIEIHEPYIDLIKRRMAQEVLELV